MTSIGFIGLGRMGCGMALNILDGGYPLSVHDQRPAATERLARRGAHVATSTASLAASCDIILVNVVNDTQVRDVMSPSTGVLSTARAGTIVVIHSTVHPSTVSDLAASAAKSEVRIVDAPASGGGPDAADTGRLTLILGGDDHDLDACESIFALMSSHRFRVGPVGSAQVVKLLNNLLAVVNGVVLNEALDLADATGIDRSAFLHAVERSTGSSFFATNRDRLRAMAQATLAVGGTDMALLARKDLNIVLSMGHTFHKPMPVARAAFDFVDGMFRLDQQQGEEQ